MPSYTFVSTANAFVLRGAKIVFVDIRPDTMNIDETLIEEAISSKTKAIVVVHYAGISCEMDYIMNLSNKYNIIVIEDAAQSMMSTYKNKQLGSIGTFGCYSFHETKNFSMGEGGALLVNDKKHISRAEIIREKGTNRNLFSSGKIDKYTWIDIGSSYLPSEINVAYLYSQLFKAEKINNKRKKSWELYYCLLKKIDVAKKIELPYVPKGCEHNGHLFYIKVKDIYERKELMNYLTKKGINTVFHYIPLHSSTAGEKYGVFAGEDVYTTKESERILRLPLYYGLKQKEIKYITKNISNFYYK